MLKYGRGTWPCNWLGLKRRGTGGGFSAGWRGFAIENELSVGDYVVYDLLEVRRDRRTAGRRQLHAGPCKARRHHSSAGQDRRGAHH